MPSGQGSGGQKLVFGDQQMDSWTVGQLDS